MNSLTGKNILVTGGSRGIGAAIVKLLASSGCRVAFTYSSNETAAKAVLDSLSGSSHFMVKMNVADEASVTDAFNQVLEKMPDLHGLVNNAGITKDQIILRLKTEDFDSVINTNLKGVYLTTKIATKVMMKARQGSIVNITSIIGQTGNVGQSNYAASKAGIEAFAKSVALELASRNVRINCVAPGFIATEMTEAIQPEAKEKMLSSIPMQKIGEGIDVAYAVRFLLSEESKYITGHTINVNGGMYMN